MRAAKEADEELRWLRRRVQVLEGRRVAPPAAAAAVRTSSSRPARTDSAADEITPRGGTGGRAQPTPPPQAPPTWYKNRAALLHQRPRLLSKTCPGPPGACTHAPLAFPIVNRFCMVFLNGHAGCLNAQTGGFRPGQRSRRRAGSW